MLYHQPVEGPLSCHRGQSHGPSASPLVPTLGFEGGELASGRQRHVGLPLSGQLKVAAREEGAGEVRHHTGGTAASARGSEDQGRVSGQERELPDLALAPPSRGSEEPTEGLGRRITAPPALFHILLVAELSTESEVCVLTQGPLFFHLQNGTCDAGPACSTDLLEGEVAYRIATRCPQNAGYQNPLRALGIKPELQQIIPLGPESSRGGLLF